MHAYMVANLKVDKSLLAWCMICCSSNNLNNKANTREAGVNFETRDSCIANRFVQLKQHRMNSSGS